MEITNLVRIQLTDILSVSIGQGMITVHKKSDNLYGGSSMEFTEDELQGIIHAFSAHMCTQEVLGMRSRKMDIDKNGI